MRYVQFTCYVPTSCVVVSGNAIEQNPASAIHLEFKGVTKYTAK